MNITDIVVELSLTELFSNTRKNKKIQFPETSLLESKLKEVDPEKNVEFQSPFISAMYKSSIPKNPPEKIISKGINYFKTSVVKGYKAIKSKIKNTYRSVLDKVDRMLNSVNVPGDVYKKMRMIMLDNYGFLPKRNEDMMKIYVSLF